MMSGRQTSSHRLLIVFVVTIFVPGLLLAVFGVRSLWQERQQAAARLQERLDYSAQLAATSLGEQLARLQRVVDQQAWSSASGPGWPADGSWAFVVRDDGVRVYPAGVLPFELRERPGPSPGAPATPAQRIHRDALARKDAGRLGEAVRLWRTMETHGGLIGSVPADLVAGFELAKLDSAAAQTFYDRLSSGRWRIDRARYQYYSDEIIERVKANPTEQRALHLAAAMEEVVAGARVVTSPRGTYVAFQRNAPWAALIVSDTFLATQVPAAADAELKVARITADERAVYGDPVRQASAPRATQAVNINGIHWEVEVEPKDAHALIDASVQRSNLYLSMLALVLALLASGGYLIARTIRREMEVARLKSDFVSTVSHEFRSPLTGIRQLAEMLSRDRVIDDGKRHQYYDLILRESERLGRLVESLLDFSRMEAGRRQYQFERLETADWLRSVVKDFEAEAARAGYALEASIPDDLPGLSGDRDALSLALRNLLDNAVKYSPQSKTVWLEARSVDNRVRILVRDRGVGIPARQQEQIFEKFYRVDGEPSKAVKGVGLGLSLVRHIVESHSGTISVESQEGHGSTFAIELAGAA